MICEITAKYERRHELNSIKITSSQDVNLYIRKVFPIDVNTREAFLSLYLNRANNTIGYAVISLGGISETICDLKIIFQHGLLCNASSMIIIHNHPSGNLNPSDTDLKLTKKIKEAGKLMTMEILDHLIISPDDNGYYSFADNGLL